MIDALILDSKIQRPADTDWDIHLNGRLCKKMHNQRIPLASGCILGVDVFWHTSYHSLSPPRIPQEENRSPSLKASWDVDHVLHAIRRYYADREPDLLQDHLRER